MRNRVKQKHKGFSVLTDANAFFKRMISHVMLVLLSLVPFFPHLNVCAPKCQGWEEPMSEGKRFSADICFTCQLCENDAALFYSLGLR